MEYWKSWSRRIQRRFFFITQQIALSFRWQRMNAFVNEAFALFLVIRKKVRVHTMCYLAEKIVCPILLHYYICYFCTQIHADTTQMLRHVFDITQMGLGRETALRHTSNICYTPVLLRYYMLSNWGRHQARFFSFCPEYVMTIYGDTSKYYTLQWWCNYLDLLSYQVLKLSKNVSLRNECILLSDIKNVKTASQTYSEFLSLSFRIMKCTMHYY